MAHDPGHCKTLPATRLPTPTAPACRPRPAPCTLFDERTRERDAVASATDLDRSDPTEGPAADPRAGDQLTMPTVTVEGEKSFEVEPGKKLVLAIEDAGIDIMHRCGGNARCTTCRVQLIAGQPTPMAELERARLEREADLGPDIRLSCQIRVESDLTVNVINRAAASGVPPGPRPAD
jgi:ferredoxin